ncbi:MAG: hypothetical protein LW860_13035 [Xanthomonadaceae bacterium]|jgi:hypothetical protein|nr:hypothetical protein [Xanthomonadaceae bacterium]
MTFDRQRHPASIAIVLLLSACGGDPPVPQDRATAAAPAANGEPVGDVVRMKVDGTDWSADRDIFCAIAPPGLGEVVIVSGSRGPKDANEQTFNLNLSGVTGPGPVQLAGGMSTTHAIQLANLDAQRYLNGGALGFDVTVDVLALSRQPAHVELRFAGTLNSSAGAPLRIDDGFVRCSE